jgi:hypothetical protein
MFERERSSETMIPGPFLIIRNIVCYTIHALLFLVLNNSEIQKYFAFVALYFVLLKRCVCVCLTNTSVELGTQNNNFVVACC